LIVDLMPRENFILKMSQLSTFYNYSSIFCCNTSHLKEVFI